MLIFIGKVIGFIMSLIVLGLMGLIFMIFEFIIYPFYYVATGNLYYEEYYNPFINAIDNLTEDSYDGRIFKWRRYTN